MNKIKLTKREENSALKKALEAKVEQVTYGELYDKVMYRDLELGDEVLPVKPLYGFKDKVFKEIMNKHNWGFTTNESKGYIQISQGSNKLFYKKKEKGATYHAFKKEREENEVFAKELLSYILKVLEHSQKITAEQLSNLKLELSIGIGMERERNNTVSVKLAYAFRYPIYTTKDFMLSDDFAILITSIVNIVNDKTMYKMVYEHAE